MYIFFLGKKKKTNATRHNELIQQAGACWIIIVRTPFHGRKTSPKRQSSATWYFRPLKCWNVYTSSHHHGLEAEWFASTRGHGAYWAMIVGITVVKNNTESEHNKKKHSSLLMLPSLPKVFKKTRRSKIYPSFPWRPGSYMWEDPGISRVFIVLQPHMKPVLLQKSSGQLVNIAEALDDDVTVTLPQGPWLTPLRVRQVWCVFNKWCHGFTIPSMGRTVYLPTWMVAF